MCCNSMLEELSVSSMALQSEASWKLAPSFLQTSLQEPFLFNAALYHLL